MSPTSPDDPAPIGGVRPPKAAQAAQGAEQAQASAAAGQAQAVDADPTAAIAEALRTGQMTLVEARRALVDMVVSEQLPADADPALIDAVRAEVDEILQADPALAELLDPAG